jgi:predicted nucleotidyltransferase component of viral defense system
VVDESLVEKDWYAIRIIAAISGVKHPKMRLVFSGGTSLAKGYGLIQRFSEDIGMVTEIIAGNLEPIRITEL